ncbi:MAG: hypothetical protein MUF18_12575 [Fimbriiglobus sp.]|nr:hypothetical protein [Fimbriiglobus sp.]
MASPVRTWLVRTGVAAVILGVAVGGYLAATWVTPERVRELVLAHLQTRFGDDVEIQLGSARMRLLGGLSVSDLQLTRKGDPEPFLSVPHVVILPDKQKLNAGVLQVRKIELTNPTVRIARLADGTWDIAHHQKPHGGGEPLPTLVVHGGMVVVTDLREGGFPRAAVRNINLTAVNDPPEIVKLEGVGELLAADALSSDGTVPEGVFRLGVRVGMRVNRPADHVSVHVETDELTVGPDHAVLLAAFNPEAAETAERFGGMVSLTADLSTNPEPGLPPKYDLRVKVRDGRLEHPAVPWPLSQLAGTVRLCDGRVTVEKLTGKLGTATAELSGESKPDLLCPAKGGGPAEVPGAVRCGPRWPQVLLAHRLLVPPTEEPECDPMKAAEGKLERFELKVFSLDLGNEMFARLNPDTQFIRRSFRPTGMVDVAVRFRRADGGWRREVDILPKGLSIEYEHFRYPITGVYGSLKKVNASDGTDEFQVKLTASVGDRLIGMDGRVAGGVRDPLVDLTIAGKGLLIDEKFLAALPGKYGEILSKVGANARGDVTVTLFQEKDVNLWRNTFKATLFDGTVRYPLFPYTLRQVRGTVEVKNYLCDPTRPTRPGEPLAPLPDRDTVTLADFKAVHDGGRLWMSGESKAHPGSPDRRLTVNVQGENCPIDGELIAGLRAMKMDVLAGEMGLSGEMTFGSDIEIIERAKPKPTANQTAAEVPDPPFDLDKDLKVAVNFRGPSIRPAAFPYDLHDLAGILRYQNGKMELENFSARHKGSTLKLAAADVRISPSGRVWANLGGISAAPLLVDAQLLKALPEGVRAELEKVNLRGPAELLVKHLVLSVPGKGGKRSPEPIQLASYRGDAITGEPGVDRWKASGDSSSFIVRLPMLAERKLPPSRPTITAAAGLLPFTLPWHPTSDKVFPPASADLPAAVVYWNASLKMNGAALDLGAACDDVYGAVASEGRYDGTGQVNVVGNAWFDRATVAKQPVANVKASYRVVPAQPDPKRPDRLLPPALVVRDIEAAVFGGSVGGQARVELNDRGRFQLWMNATGVKLEDLARHHKLGSGELKGDAQGTVLLETVPDPKTGKMVLSGTGQVDVPQGRLYNLPVLLELVKVLKGQTPDGVAFEEAHATFDLKGDRIKVTQLDLLGSAVSLGGSGEMDFTGKDVRFEFYTIWSQTLRRWLTTPFGDVTGLLSGGLFKIELTRVNGELVPKAHMLPAVTDPVRAMAERWRNRLGRDTPSPTVRGASR